MIVRKEFSDLISQAEKHMVTILTGSRQVGKSTLLRMIQEELNTPSEYYDLENPLHLSLFNEGYSSFIRQNKAKLVFIDEFPYCRNISSIFKAMHDLNPDMKVYASGSSSLEMQAHLKESLAGRKIDRVIYPFTFSEWLTQFKPYVPSIPSWEVPFGVDAEEEIRRRLPEFLRFGAMPGLVHLESEIDKREYLFGIYQTYIAKDIKSFLRDESVLSFNKMITYLALNNGGQLKKSTLAAVSGLSSRQIDRHLDVLTGTYVLSLLPPLSQNKGKELVKTPKFYFYDQGVLNSIIQDFRPLHLRQDQGMMNEQFVYWELKKNLDIRYRLAYWRTADGKEVDFILEKDREYLPIEVKTTAAEKIPSGILHFFSYYPETRAAVILHDGPEAVQSHEGRRIFFAPLYKACRVFEVME